MSIQCQSSANPFQSDAYQTSILCNQVPIDPNLTPIWRQYDTNPMSIRWQSGTSRAPIQCQSSAFPFQSHQVPIHLQSCQSCDNLMPILWQFIAIPESIMCQSIPNLSPIRCQSRQSVSNPSPLRCQQRVNPVPIQFKSDVNSVSILPINGQFNVNPVPIHPSPVPT